MNFALIKELADLKLELPGLIYKGLEVDELEAKAILKAWAEETMTIREMHRRAKALVNKEPVMA